MPFDLWKVHVSIKESLGSFGNVIWNTLRKPEAELRLLVGDIRVCNRSIVHDVFHHVGIVAVAKDGGEKPIFGDGWISETSRTEGDADGVYKETGGKTEDEGGNSEQDEVEDNQEGAKAVEDVEGEEVEEGERGIDDEIQDDEGCEARRRGSAGNLVDQVALTFVALFLKRLGVRGAGSVGNEGRAMDGSR